MNSNPFLEDPNSGEIRPLDQFDPSTPVIEVSKLAQTLLEKIPMEQRVNYVANSTEPELASEREQLAKLFREGKTI